MEGCAESELATSIEAPDGADVPMCGILPTLKTKASVQAPVCNIVKGSSSPAVVIGTVSENKSGWRRMKVAVDSGAAESVIPRDEAPEYERRAHPEPIYYATCSGEPLQNLGEVKVPMVCPSKQLKGMTFQSCDVTKPLAAVANMLDAGQAVIFAPEDFGGSCILDLATGVEEPLTREDGNFILHVWVPPPKALETPFGGQP